MSILILYTLIGIIGVVGTFKLLKIPYNMFNVIIGFILVVFAASHMFLLMLIGLGVLYIIDYVKNKIFKKPSDEINKH